MIFKKIFKGLVIANVVVFGLDWLITGKISLLVDSKQAQVHRELSERSHAKSAPNAPHAFDQNQVQELKRLQSDYVYATPDQKQALASTILRRAADLDERQLTSELAAFIQQVRRDHGGDATEVKGHSQ